MQSTRYSFQILMNLGCSRQFKKKARISNFMKIRALVAEFHADEETHRQTWRS